jgi:hypothetical protein
MASIKYDHKTGKARIFFRYSGRQFNRTIRVKSERAGLALCETIDLTLSDLECGKASLPDDVDVASFLLSGGKLLKAPAQTMAQAESITLSDLIELYQAAPPPHLEKSTQRMQEIPFRRLKEVFASKPIEQLTRTDAQNYVLRRSQQRFRGKPIRPETIEKELQTLRQSWA